MFRKEMTLGYPYLRQAGVIPRHEGSLEVLYMLIILYTVPHDMLLYVSKTALRFMSLVTIFSKVLNEKEK
jgi:hypothetical protein